MNDVQGLLGLAAKARKLSFGDSGMKDIRAKKAKLVIMSADIGENSHKKLVDKCTYYHVRYVYMDDDKMNTAIGQRNRKFIVILDEGFAQKLHTCLKG